MGQNLSLVGDFNPDNEQHWDLDQIDNCNRAYRSRQCEFTVDQKTLGEILRAGEAAMTDEGIDRMWRTFRGETEGCVVPTEVGVCHASPGVGASAHIPQSHRR